MRSVGSGHPSLGWLWLLVAVAVLTQGAVHLIRPTTTYKLIELGADGMTVGLVTAVYSLLPVLFALFTAARAQRAVSLRPLLLTGTLLLGAGAAVVAGAPTVLAIAAASALLGVGQIVVVIARQAAIARFASNQQLDFAFGWFTAGFSAGQMTGPLVGGMLLEASASGTASHAAAGAIDLTLWLGAVLTGLIFAMLLFSGRAFHQNRHLPGLSLEGGDSAPSGTPRAPRQGGLSHTRRIIRTPTVNPTSSHRLR